MVWNRATLWSETLWLLCWRNGSTVFHSERRLLYGLNLKDVASCDEQLCKGSEGNLTVSIENLSQLCL
jgi:hypothetical protein